MTAERSEPLAGARSGAHAVAGIFVKASGRRTPSIPASILCAAAAVILRTRNDPFGPRHPRLGAQRCQIALQISNVVVPQATLLQLGSKTVTARENPVRLLGGG